MSRIRVGVLRGGRGQEYHVSLETGASVLAHLPAERYEPIDILITKDGLWHLNGFPMSLRKIATLIDVAFNALHGEYGEDGQVQHELAVYAIPHTGSSAIPSALGMNKELAKGYFRAAGIKTPRSVAVRRGDDAGAAALEVMRTIPPPYVVKPLSGGSSVGVSLTRNFDGLLSAIEYTLAHAPAVLVEEFIKGKEVSCGVVEGKSLGRSYATPPTEIVLPEGEELFRHDLKYGTEARVICPARLSRGEEEIIKALALRAHRGLGARHYSVSDFIVAQDGIYILEINTLPGLTGRSLLPYMLAHAGIRMDEFTDHVLALALERA